MSAQGGNHEAIHSHDHRGLVLASAAYARGAVAVVAVTAAAVASPTGAGTTRRATAAPTAGERRLILPRRQLQCTAGPPKSGCWMRVKLLPRCVARRS